MQDEQDHSHNDQKLGFEDLLYEAWKESQIHKQDDTK
jgi:hypothetical protein